LEGDAATNRIPDPPFHENQRIFGDGTEFDVRVLLSMMDLPNVDDLNVALDAIGALGPTVEQYQNQLNSHPMRVAILNRVTQLSSVGSGVDAAAVGRCLRTMLAVQVGTVDPFSLAWHHVQQSLRAWIKVIRTHDVNFLSQLIIHSLPRLSVRPAGTAFQRLINWHQETSVMVPPHGPLTSPAIWTTNSVAMNWTAPQAIMFFLFAGWDPLLDSSQGRAVLVALVGMIHRTLDQVIDLPHYSYLRGEWSATKGIPERDSAGHHITSLWGFFVVHRHLLISLFGPSGVSQFLTPANPDTIIGPLTDKVARLGSESGIVSGQSLHDVGFTLRYFSTHDSLAVNVGQNLRSCAAVLLAGAFARDGSQYWSAHLNNILRHLLVQPPPQTPFADPVVGRDTTQADGELNRSMLATSLMRETGDCKGWFAHLGQYIDAEEAIIHSRLNLLSSISTPDGSHTTTWDALVGIHWDAEEAPTRSALAAGLVVQLCAMRRSGQDVSEMFERLLGGDRGAELVRCAGHDAVRWAIAIHAKEIAESLPSLEGWWDTTAQSLRDAEELYLDELVMEVNATGRCTNCGDSVEFRGTWRDHSFMSDKRFSAPPSPLPASTPTIVTAPSLWVIPVATSASDLTDSDHRTRQMGTPSPRSSRRRLFSFGRSRSLSSERRRQPDSDLPVQQFHLETFIPPFPRGGT